MVRPAINEGGSPMRVSAMAASTCASISSCSKRPSMSQGRPPTGGCRRMSPSSTSALAVVWPRTFLTAASASPAWKAARISARSIRPTWSRRGGVPSPPRCLLALLGLHPVSATAKCVRRDGFSVCRSSRHSCTATEMRVASFFVKSR